LSLDQQRSRTRQRWWNRVRLGKGACDPAKHYNCHYFDRSMPAFTLYHSQGTMKLLLKLILIVLIGALALGAFTIWRNGVAWFEPPGFWTRIAFYTMRSTIETAPRHVLPELRPQVYAATPKEIYEHVHSVLLSLGWRIVDFDPAARRIHAVVTTPLLRFKDDFNVTVNPDSTLHIRSSSRIGRADYGANLGHVLKFKHELSRRLAFKNDQSSS